eukprot:3540850-Karenia_brevis.AAC.1
MEEHPDRLEEAQHNDHADRIAKDAKGKFYNPNLIRLSSLFADRTDNYLCFIQSIHRIIVRVFLATQVVRHSKAFQLERPTLEMSKFVHFASPCFDDHLIYAPLAFKISNRMH